MKTACQRQAGYVTGVSLWLALWLAGCASAPQHPEWEARLKGDAIVLLGEVHDNALHHRERLDVLRRAFAAGWRPAIAMEQFDRERQGDIDRARREPKPSAQQLIAAASLAKGSKGGGWRWEDYRPFVALALEYDVPLIAANLSAADTGRVVRDGYAAVFDAATLRRLRLDQPVPSEMQAAQEREMDEGHCNALPAKMVPAMARAQQARDAVMADMVARHAARGVVLIAGNGHVRRDTGVPYWLSAELRARTLAVGYLETDDAVAPAGRFDVIVRTAPAQRSDPCLELRARFKKPPALPAEQR